MSESPTARWKVNAGASSSERFAACAERRDRQPEAGDSDGERVEVDAVDGVERGLDAGPDLKVRRVLVPALQQSVEGAQQEVAGPAGGVDELETFEGPFLQGGFEGLVEDELLDEDRRLQQRVGVLGVLGEVLIQVAEEPCRQRLVGQVVNESPAFARPPEVQQRRHRITRRCDEAQRRMLVDQRLCGRQGREVIDGLHQPLTVGALGMGAEEGKLRVEGLLPTTLRPGDPHRLDQRVVFAEPDEHRGEHPGDRGLGHPVITPGHPRRRGTFLDHRPLVLLLPVRLQLGVGRHPLTQVVLQDQNLSLEIGGQGRRRGHDAPSAVGTRPWASIQSASRRKNWPGAASGSGRRSMTAPWLPASCGTSSQMACGRRVARSAHRLSMARWSYRASGAISVSRTGRLPSGASADRRIDRRFDGGKAALDEHGQPGGIPAARRGRVRRPDGVPREPDLRGLRPHGLDEDLGHVDHFDAELAAKRIDGAVGPGGVHAEREERPCARAFGQALPDSAAGR